MRKLAIAAILAVMLASSAPGVYAFEYHVDPDTVSTLYSGTALLQYYSNSLDFVIEKNPVQTQEYLGVLPFANVPDTITDSATDFAQSAIPISQLLSRLDQLFAQQNAFISQSRLNEALGLSDAIYNEIRQGLSEVDILEQSAVLTGEELKVSGASPQGLLKLTYDEVIAKIERIRAMFALLSDTLKNSILQNLIINSYVQTGKMPDLTQPGYLDQLAGSTNPPGVVSPGTLSGLFPPGTSPQTPGNGTIADILSSGDLADLISSGQLGNLLQNTNPADLFQPTSLTLDITPRTAYVGDNVHFEAVLTSKGMPLPGRKVYILLDGAAYVTGTTDTNGRCSGELMIPFKYVPQMDAQAFYQPQGDDIGLFLASLSPTVIINVLFYPVSLGISADGAAYPGKTATINGTLGYGDAPPLIGRAAGIYLDGALLADLTVDTNISFTFPVESRMAPGKHTITLSAPADGRYAPAEASATLEVEKATPVLVLNTPKVAFVPGTAHISGAVSSKFGPLAGAVIRIVSGKQNVEVTTASDGTFAASLKMGMDFTLLGSRPVSIQVSPGETWNGALSESRSMFSLNYVNCSLAAILLAFLGVYMPRRLRKRLGLTHKQTPGAPETFILDIPAVYAAATSFNPVKATVKEPDKPGDRIFYWYRRVLKFLLKLAGLVPRPQQTMREFARESGAAFEPVSKYVLELTLMAERFFYGSHEALKDDADKSQELAKNIGSQIKDETV